MTHSSRYIIGRADNCDIQVKSKDISRYHCSLDLEGERVFIEDMGSGNGTFVNGREITERYQLIKGDRLKLGDTVILEISQIGKECHKKCAIYYQAGDCIMPREGVFAKVIEGGSITCNDRIEIC